MKKAQTAVAASTLVAIIAGVIILYILFLPAEERQSLLNITDENGEKGIKTEDKETLVFEHPGLLDYLKETEREHSIPSINLMSKTDALVLKEADAVYIKNGWFNKKSYNMEFQMADLENTDNALLSFNIKQARGRLVVDMNGNELYNSEAALGNIEPIKLPKNLLSAENTIELSVSNVGAAFWRLNEYNLEDVKVIADVTDVSKRASENIFIISSTEKENIDETRLRFLPDCLASEVGKLTVKINNKDIYSAVPDCGLPSTIPFLPDYIKSGENKITFSTTQGSYFIDYITIRAKLKEIAYPLYYFDLDEEEIEDIETNDANVTLYLKFVDGNDKRADIVVNGHKTYMDTDESEYEKIIDAFLEEGNNYVQIQPKTALNIVDLKVLWND